jgi:2-methylcitrate dehydratase PrpD
MTQATAAPTPVFAVTSSVTAEVTRRAAVLRFEDLPPDVVEIAKHCVLDWFGVALAGAAEPVTRILREQALAEGGAPQAVLVGTGERVSRSQAALVNGAASHALDFDDVSSAMGGHPSVPVLPALLALAEGLDLDGKTFLTAFVAGFEAECRVGRLMAPEHYSRGFHATGTVGTFGAAAACAAALGLSLDQWQIAFGIAGTQAAGLKSMFGTMCKPFHAGKAALNGLTSALLAQQGFTAHPEVLDVAQGFPATQTSTPNPDRALELQPGEFDLRDVLFKFHAACYFTHSSIEALLRLRETHGLQPEQVAEVELRVPPQHLAACNIPEPVTPLEGKFSLRFTSALVLAGAQTTDRAFTPESVRDPALVSLRDRVRVTPDPGQENSHASLVRVTLANGDVLTDSVDMSIPTPVADLPRQWERLVTKFRGLADPVLGADRAAALLAAVESLEHQSSCAALAALAAPDRQA